MKSTGKHTALYNGKLDINKLAYVINQKRDNLLNIIGNSVS